MANEEISLICNFCSKPFNRRLAEYERQIGKGNERVFCSRSCAAIDINARTVRKGNPEYLIFDNRRDEWTPFRWFILRARQRKHKGETNITVEYLKELWDKQSSICPFTGWKLNLPDSTIGWKSGASPKNASLDRIDNNQGYIIGNVRFISIMANLARGTFKDEEVIEFCKAVVSAQTL